MMLSLNGKRRTPRFAKMVRARCRLQTFNRETGGTKRGPEIEAQLRRQGRSQARAWERGDAVAVGNYGRRDLGIWSLSRSAGSQPVPMVRPFHLPLSRLRNAMAPSIFGSFGVTATRA